MRRKAIIVTGITLSGLFALAAIGLSLLINIDRFRPQLAHAMSTALGREVTIGHIGLSLLSGSAVVENLSIAEDPSFGRAPFVTARAVRVGIAVLPLITSKQLRIESLRLLKPRVTLRRSAAGTWNFSTIGGSSSAGSAAPSSSNLTLSIDRLAITDGSVLIETASTSSPAAAYEALNLDMRDFSPTTATGFTVNVATPGGGKVKVNGRAGPLSSNGLGSTPFDATIDATRLDMLRGGFVQPGDGLGGVLDFHSRIVSNGARISASGTLRADRLQLVPGATPASQPVDLTYASDYDLSAHEGVVSRGDVRVGNAMARVRGRFTTRTATPAVQLTLAGHQMPVTDLQAILPAVGAALPRGARFRSGVLDADLTARGPLARLVIAGPIAMTGATLSGFDFGSRMQTLASLAGGHGSGETVVETFRVTMRVAPDGIRADGLSCVVASVGRVDGSGTIAPNGALDFKMVAALKHTTGIAGEFVRMASLGHPETGVPFRITGTTASPVFVPDVARAASEAIKDPGTLSKATGFMRSLFGSNKR